MRLKKTFNVVVLSVFSFGKYRILTYTERYQRSFEVARATYKYIKGPLLVTVRLEGYYMDRFPVHGGNRNA